MNKYLEIQDFCEQTRFYKESNEIEYIWADSREISKIIIDFKVNFKTEQIKNQILVDNVQYWQNTWPKYRPSDNNTGSGASGWKRQDDWYKGMWQDSDFQIKSDFQQCTILFNELNKKEFPNENYPVEFRKTLKIKIKFNSFFNIDLINNCRIFTTSQMSTINLKIQIDGGFKVNWNEIFNVKIFNGIVLDDNSVFKILYTIPRDQFSYDQTIISLSFKNYNLFRNISRLDKFSFLIDDLIQHKFIFSPDLGVLIQIESSQLNLKSLNEQYKKYQTIYTNIPEEKDIFSRRNKSIYDRINDLPEQTYSRSMSEFQDKHRLYGVIGCEGIRSKCAVTETGNLSVAKEFIMKNRGLDTDKVFWGKKYSRIKFQWRFNDKDFPTNNNNLIKRYRDDYYPVFYCNWQQSALKISIEQKIYAVPLFGYKDNNLNPDSDLIAMNLFSIENLNDKAVKCDLIIRIGEIEKLIQEEEEPSPIFKKIIIKKDLNKYFFTFVKESTVSLPYLHPYQFIFDPCNNSPIEQYSINSNNDYLTVSFQIESNKKYHLLLKLPFLSLVPKMNSFEDNQIISLYDSLKKLDFDSEYNNLKIYWDNLVDKSAKLVVPNNELSLFYKSNLINTFITNDREIGSDRIFGRVGAMGYGTFLNEVCMIIQDLDRKGLFNTARNMLDVFIQYQGTAGLDGDYNDIEGIYFGANGYESGIGYNQNQGFVLWTIVEHVYLSGDYEWFQSIIESIVKGCEWIINERKVHLENINKIKPLNKAFAYEGLLPPGGVEDITDYWYWLSTNSYNAYGLLQAAVLLKQIQYKNADELLNEALEYFRQVRALFYGAMQDSPLIQLRNGTFIPHFPCHITRRGRGYGWIQETLEGAMHLIRCGIIPYWSKEAEWIIQDYEDNLYLSDKFGYPLNEDEFEKFWFNRGGFSMQPWLLCNHIIYLIRNQPKHYLRAFFNSFAVNYREDTKMFTEHPLPTMFDWFGQLYKTSDESNFINCLRAMIIQEGISSIDNISNINGVNQNELVKLAIEQYDSLRLFNCVPMEWFEHEKKIKLENIATFFGLVSLEFTSKIKYQQVDIALKIDSNHLKSLKLSNPIILKYIYVAIRLSDEKLSIKSVKIHDNMQNKDITKIDVKINHQTFEINLNSIITQSNCIDLLFKVIF